MPRQGGICLTKLAATYCDILVMRKADLFRVIRDYPQVRAQPPPPNRSPHPRARSGAPHRTRGVHYLSRGFVRPGCVARVGCRCEDADVNRQPAVELLLQLRGSVVGGCKG